MGIQISPGIVEVAQIFAAQSFPIVAFSHIQDRVSYGDMGVGRLSWVAQICSRSTDGTQCGNCCTLAVEALNGAPLHQEPRSFPGSGARHWPSDVCVCSSPRNESID